jgi:hypothetical protein
MLEKTNGTNLCGVNKNTLKISSNLDIIFYGFLREKRYILANSRKDGLAHLG